MAEPFTPKELEFIEAIERYKAANNKGFLSWTEVLAIVEQLGYRRVIENSESGTAAEGTTVEQTPLEKTL